METLTNIGVGISLLAVLLGIAYSIPAVRAKVFKFAVELEEKRIEKEEEKKLEKEVGGGDNKEVEAILDEKKEIGVPLGGFKTD